MGALLSRGTWSPSPLSPPRTRKYPYYRGSIFLHGASHRFLLLSYSRFLSCVIVEIDESRRGDLCHPLFFSRQRRKREGKIVVLIEFREYGVVLGSGIGDERETAVWNLETKVTVKRGMSCILYTVRRKFNSR